MVDLTLDQALPVVQDLAGRKANAFVRRCGLGVDEREDVESQLVLTSWRAGRSSTARGRRSGHSPRA